MGAAPRPPPESATGCTQISNSSMRIADNSVIIFGDLPWRDTLGQTLGYRDTKTPHDRRLSKIL